MSRSSVEECLSCGPYGADNRQAISSCGGRFWSISCLAIGGAPCLCTLAETPQSPRVCRKWNVRTTYACCCATAWLTAETPQSPRVSRQWNVRRAAVQPAHSSHQILPNLAAAPVRLTIRLMPHSTSDDRARKKLGTGSSQRRRCARCPVQSRSGCCWRTSSSADKQFFERRQGSCNLGVVFYVSHIHMD